jgi:hypothetical protein
MGFASSVQTGMSPVLQTIQRPSLHISAGLQCRASNPVQCGNLGDPMRRRSRGGVKPAKTRHRNAVERRGVAKTVACLSSADETKIALLTHERDEALEQLSATSEVLKVISASPVELELVFRSILNNATRICQANFGTLFLREGEAFRVAAHRGSFTKAWDEQWRAGMMLQPDADLQAFQAFSARQPVQVADPAGHRRRQRWAGSDQVHCGVALWAASSCCILLVRKNKAAARSVRWRGG